MITLAVHAAVLAGVPGAGPERMDLVTIEVTNFVADDCSGDASSVFRYTSECAFDDGGTSTKTGLVGMPLFLSRIYRGASCASGGLLETYKGKACEAYTPTLKAPASDEAGLLSSQALPAGMSWGRDGRGICDGAGTRFACGYGRGYAAWTAPPTPVPSRGTKTVGPANVAGTAGQPDTVVQMSREENARLNRLESGAGAGARPSAPAALLAALAASAVVLAAGR